MNKVPLYLSALIIVAILDSSCRKKADSQGSHSTVNKVVETDPAILTPIHKLINGNIRGFYEAVPAHYYETEEVYPVLICFHGGGQYGYGDTALVKILTDGIPKRFSDKTFPPTFTVNGERFSFIMIAPQFSREPFVPDVVDLVNYVKANYRVDTARIYLSGFSLGAKKLTDYAAAYPYTIAAITAMGGAMNITEDYDSRVKAIADAKLPAWQFHNVDDTLWTYHESERFVQTYNSFDPVIPAKLTLFPVGESAMHHDCWTKTTDPAWVGDNGLNIYQWMLQYER